MLFSRLQHWWEIYAPFQAVTTMRERETSVHPHQGQVIRYRRLMSGKTRREVAKILHWSEATIRKAEEHPDGTRDLKRNFALIPLLQISPRLLDTPEGFFLPDTPDDAHAILMEQIQPLCDNVEDRTNEIKKLVSEYERTRIPSYLPLSAQERRLYDEITIMCLVVLMQMTDPMELMSWMTSRDILIREELGIHEMNFSQLDPALQFAASKMYKMHKHLPSSLICRDKLLEGLALVEEWQKKISQTMDQAAGFRRDQLLYAKYSLYETLGYLQLFKPVIDAELGPEKQLSYAKCRLVCAQLLGNVILMARPLIERMTIFLESGQGEQALEDFHQLQYCLDMMGQVLGCWSEMRTSISSLDGCIALAKGGMKVRLRHYQWRMLALINSRMSSAEYDDREDWHKNSDTVH